MQNNSIIQNKTKRNVKTDHWLRWIKQFCKNPPYNVFIINNPFNKDHPLYCRGGFLFGEIYVFNSSKETQKSLDWIFLHELAHWIIVDNEEMGKITDSYDKDLKLYINEEEEIQLDDDITYEEFFADMFATLVLGKYYGPDWYDQRGTK